MITIQRKSMISGKTNSMAVPMTAEEFNAAWQQYQQGSLLQNVFHMLSAELREFIKTGITPQEWDGVFGEDEEEAA